MGKKKEKNQFDLLGKNSGFYLYQESETGEELQPITDSPGRILSSGTFYKNIDVARVEAARICRETQRPVDVFEVSHCCRCRPAPIPVVWEDKKEEVRNA